MDETKVRRKRSEVPVEGRRISVTLSKEELKSVQKLAIDLEIDEKAVIKAAIDYILLAKKRLLMTQQSETISFEQLKGLLEEK